MEPIHWPSPWAVLSLCLYRVPKSSHAVAHQAQFPHRIRPPLPQLCLSSLHRPSSLKTVARSLRHRLVGLCRTEGNEKAAAYAAGFGFSPLFHQLINHNLSFQTTNAVMQAQR